MSLVIRQSRIHSYGCYTTRPLRKGTLVVEYVGERLTYEQADDLYDPYPQTYLFGLDGGKHIIDGYGVAAFINHSCDPNCDGFIENKRIWIKAVRDIAPGEELAYDYKYVLEERHTPGRKRRFPCHCGSAKCRGTILAKKR